MNIFLQLLKADQGLEKSLTLSKTQTEVSNVFLFIYPVNTFVATFVGLTCFLAFLVTCQTNISVLQDSSLLEFLNLILS